MISLPPKITNRYVPMAATTPLWVLSGLSALIQEVYSPEGVGRRRAEWRKAKVV